MKFPKENPGTVSSVQFWNLWLGTDGGRENEKMLYNLYFTMYCLKFYSEGM